MFFVCLFDKNCIYMTSKPSIKASSKKNVGNLTLRNYLSDYAKIRKIKSSSNVSITKNQQKQQTNPQDIFQEKVKELLNFVHITTNDEQVLKITEKFIEEIVNLHEASLKKIKSQSKETTSFSESSIQWPNQKNNARLSKQVGLVNSLTNQNLNNKYSQNMKDKQMQKAQNHHTQISIKKPVPLKIFRKETMPILQRKFDDDYLEEQYAYQKSKKTIQSSMKMPKLKSFKQII